MKPCPNKPFLLTALFILLPSSSSARDIITPSTPLADNETLISSDGSFALGFFTPPDSNNRYVGLWYNLIPDHTILWVANRENPLVNSPGLLSITKDGRLTISNQTSFIVWSTNPTKGLTNPIAQLLDNGNLVVKQSGDAGENYLWQGFDFPTDTLIPGMRIGVDLATGINRTLTAWKSRNDPSPSTYHVYMDIKGDPEMYFCDGPNIIWRSGAWYGVQFSGKFIYNFANNASEVTYSYSNKDRNFVSRLLLNSTGVSALWWQGSNQWSVLWTAPYDRCDNFGECGAYGHCDSNNLPICTCLQGFAPKNPQNWNLADWHEGCVRNTKLDCKNGADGFMPVSDVKLPQSENAIVDMSLNLVQCRDTCLKNCSCVGYASANASGGGSGCVIWIGQLFDIRNYVTVGQDLYVRLAAADLHFRASSVKPHKSRIKVIAISVSLVFGILLLSCICCFLRKRKKRRQGVKDKSNEMDRENSLELPLVDFHTIVSATDNFSAENKLGEGGFGPVYKGKLREDQEVAVKRLCKTSQQGVDEFRNEVMLIAKLQHRNLVRLLGCYIHGEERMLIYEYMPNKSLDAFLFGKDETTFLSWRTRYQIIIGIARGLLYLHQDSRFRIIHRDLKASNILLDKDMIPKISDFGMARIFEGDETDFNTRKVAGTYGYMSPEYALEGTFSMKSDIFSFGVLVLEIVSGRKNRGLYAFSPHLNLLAHAWSLWSEGDILQLVEEGMSSVPTDVILKCIKIGLLCVQGRPEDRPLMSNVIEIFGSDISSLPQPNPPGFVSRFGPLEIDRQEPCSLNGVSITELSGR